jgi:hypothetical protein
VNHPPLTQLADHARAVAKTLDLHAGHDRTRTLNGTCRCINCLARRLGTDSIGWPTGTLGDGTGARTADPTSSTERAVLDPDRWATIDRDLDHALRAWWHAGLTVLTLVDQITAHAPDDDPVPAGTGPCTIRTCDTTCRPTAKRPDNRLRSGLCPACRDAWARYLRRHPNATLTEWRPVRTAYLRPKPIAS